jgi:DNA modification methylase
MHAAQTSQEFLDDDVGSTWSWALFATKPCEPDQRRREEQEHGPGHRGERTRVGPAGQDAETWLQGRFHTYNPSVTSPSSSPTLEWAGKSTLIDRSGQAGRLVPEAAEAPIRLLRGDNLPVLDALAAREEGAVTFAYLDPPFLTGKIHHQVTRTRNGITGELERATRPAFDDRWTELGSYLEALRQRIVRVRRLLASHGSMVLHVDTRTSHYAKVLCDEIFGPECFASEVVWRYRRWPSKTKNFQRVHDVMLRYVKDADASIRFNQLYEPLAPSTRATWGTKKQLAVVGANGRRMRSSTTDSESQGTPLGDVWDIGIIAPVAKERTGYPTQKPEALLARWIEACTDPEDLVLDPYVGSGTTLVVAARLGRRAIGIDQGDEALAAVAARLRAADIPFAQQELMREPVKARESRQAAGRIAS